MPRKRMVPADRRRALLEAGLSLFGSRPYDDVSIRDICDRAGVSRPLLQHYFGNKQAFFVAVIGMAMAELERTTRSADSNQGFDALPGNLRAFFSFMVEHPVGVAVARLDAGGVGESAQKLFDDYRNHTFDLVAQTIGVEQVTPKVAAAIRCWIALNETITAQLLAQPDLGIDWAASFSQRMLFSLVKEADE